MAHWSVWESWAADVWVVQVLRFSYRIPFRSRPPLSPVPIPLPSYSPNSIRGLALSDAVCALVEKEAIEIAPPSPGFYSRLFVTPKVTGGYRPLTPQWLGGTLQFSYGDCPVRSTVSPSGGLDGVPGSPGRLPPGSCTSGLSPFPEVLRGGCGVSISDPVLRPVFRSPGVHQRHGSYIFHHASPRVSSSPLSRRLAGPGLHLPGSGACEGFPPLAMSSPRGHSQSSEELFGPDSDVGLSRDDTRDFSFEGFPDPQTDSEVLSTSPGVFIRPSPPCVGLVESSRDDVVHVCHRSGFSAPYAIPSTSPQCCRASPARRSSCLLGRWLPQGSSAFPWVTTSQISVCSPTPQIKVGVQLSATSICPACGLPFARAFPSISASSWLFSLPCGVFCLTSEVRLWRFTQTTLRLWLISGRREAPIRRLRYFFASARLSRFVFYRSSFQAISMSWRIPSAVALKS